MEACTFSHAKNARNTVRDDSTSVVINEPNVVSYVHTQGVRKKIEKTAQSLMHRNFTNVSHRVTRFHRNVQKLFDNTRKSKV